MYNVIMQYYYFFFYRFIPVEVYIPNPLRCFNCQRFGHHENGCPVPDGSVCEKCGMGDFDHPTHACKNQAKCVNCNKSHFSKLNEYEIWKKREGNYENQNSSISHLFGS